MPFLTFLWFNLTEETEFLKAVVPTIFEILKKILLQNLMLCKVFDSKYERVVTSLIQNLILPEVFESKNVLFPQNHLSQNLVFQNITNMPTVLFLQCKMNQRIWFFKANSPMNFDCLKTVLLHNLMHCKSFGLNSDGC